MKDLICDGAKSFVVPLPKLKAAIFFCWATKKDPFWWFTRTYDNCINGQLLTLTVSHPTENMKDTAYTVVLWRLRVVFAWIAPKEKGQP